LVHLSNSWTGRPNAPLSIRVPRLRTLTDNRPGVIATGSLNLSGDADPERVPVAFATTNIFDVLGGWLRSGGLSSRRI
jgi:hypothetical protein